MLSCGPSIHPIHPHDQAGSTALMLAAQYGHASIVGVLLESGADVDVKDNVSVLVVPPSSQLTSHHDRVCRMARLLLTGHVRNLTRMMCVLGS